MARYAVKTGSERTRRRFGTAACTPFRDLGADCGFGSGSYTKRPQSGASPCKRILADRTAALTAADATLKSITPHGEQDKPVGEYLQSDCKRLIEYVVVDKDRTGSVKRFGNTSSSHATLIAAESGGIYALSVQGSGLVYGTTPDIAEQVTYVDDLTGSAAYKKYLAGIVFTLGR